QRKPTPREVVAAAETVKPRVLKTGRAGASRNAEALVVPPSALAMLARGRKLDVGTPSALLPPPVMSASAGGAGGRQPGLPALPVVAPAPGVGGSAGSRRINAPGAGVVPPPDVQGAMAIAGRERAGRIGGGQLGSPAGGSDVSVVPPP